MIPGRNPGTSSKVTSGIPNASQNLTNLAPLIEARISKQPRERRERERERNRKRQVLRAQ